MAQTIKLKRSATQNAVPSTSSLALGELAINTYDGKLFIKKNVGGTESIVTIGEVGAGSIGPTELASTAVTAGSYGSTSAIPVITIDADGRITSASTATISGLSADSVTATEIAANAVGISELNVSDGTNGQVLSTNGSGTLSFVDQSGGAASATAFSTNIASGDGSTTDFTLSESPSAESKIIAFINGVFQNQDAYTISGTTLTFDTAPISGTNNVVVYVVGDVYSGESVLISNFSGNGTTTAFTLSNNPGNENNTQVYIDGVYQQKTTYSVSGTTLTFSSAPPTGTNNIEVVMLTSTTVNTPAAGSVVTASMADDSVTASKIVSSAVTTAKIADANVTTAKIADDAVTIGKIADAALVIESEGIGSNDNDTTLPTSAAVKDYVDTQVAGKDALSELSGDTDDITEGSTNLYYTDARVGTYISGNRTYGNITTTGYIAGPSTFTIDPAAVGDNTGTLVIAGNLQVDGTTTTINSTTMTVDDKLVTLASGSANAAAADGAGIDIDISGVANPSLRYDGTNDEWSFNRAVNVNGNVTINTDANSKFTIADGGTDAVTLYGGSGDELYIGANAAYKLRFKTDGNIVMDNGGSFGIGTASPQKALDIAGASSSGGAVIRLSGTGEASQGDVTGAIQFYSADTTDNTPGVFGMIRGIAGASGGEGSLQILTDMPSEGADASNITMHFNANGRVGIGTSSPNENLEIRDDNPSGNTGIRIHNNSASHAAILELRGGRTSANDCGQIIFNNSGNNVARIDAVSGGDEGQLRFFTSATGTGSSVVQAMHIDTSGNVGIGTTSVFDSNTRLELKKSGNCQFFVSSSDSSGVRMVASAFGTSFGKIGTYSNHAFRFDTNDTERMRISDGGKVGIGTSSPASALEVNNLSAGDTVATFEGSYGSGGDVQLVRYERSGGAVYGAISYKDATTDMEFGNISSHSLSFTTANTRRMTIVSDGAIGFGTDAPFSYGGQNFEFKDTSSAQTGVRITSSASSFEIGTDSSGGYLQAITPGDGIRFYTANSSAADTTAMSLSSTGKVGIGTTSPSEALTVTGAICQNTGQPTASNGQFVHFNTGSQTVSSNTTSTVTLLTRSPNAEVSSTGTCYVAAENSGGSVQFGYIIDFFYSNGSLQTTARETGSSQGTVTVSIAESGSTLQISVAYSGGLGGAIKYTAAGHAVNASY